MILLSIFAMTAVVFLSRYLFLEPVLPLRLSYEVKRFLKFSSPAILTAILAPIMFLDAETHELLPLINPYLISAILAVILAWKTANVLMTTVVSMMLFFTLHNGWF
ncbi:branched-chain amino acid ABC transporter [Vibrio genomosp. F10 str. ZF-129]|uniref:Branched-chain amino acid ABC transporter n=1 Tax=Vibrio genomosp. F10 str. ZF-129 TaxID=1187848 RepID=A0A1E5BDM1_9VIBR|nr:AzlD domain-containing protein [Vibrio genomosp. F10]OEE33227.1 branched-chain amino acid ABC transporter [Vibrio genomosp. F10 str. ZF-129]